MPRTPRGQSHSPVEHGVEEAAEGGGVLSLRVVIVGHGLVAEEHREEIAGGLDDVRNRRGGQGVGHGLLQLRGPSVDVGIDLCVGEPEGGEPGSRGHRVA